MQPAGGVARDILRLAHEPESVVPVAGLPGGRAEAGQRERLQARETGLAGHVHRPAGVVARLGQPAHLLQRR